jgi:5-methylcytosine-specific restriction endonuclease McrA
VGDRRGATRAFRRYAWNRYPLCQWCGRRLGWREATADHVMPLAAGGTNAWSNLVISCGPCNHDRGGRLPDREPRGPRWSRPADRNLRGTIPWTCP